MTSSLDPTGPIDNDLIDLAAPYAVHAVSDAERDDIEARVAAARPYTADTFFDEVRAIRESMATVSAITALEPPTELRERILAEVAGDNVTALPSRAKDSGRQRGLIAVAAALLIGLGAVGIGIAIRPSSAPTVSTAQEIFTAPDVRTITGEIPTGGQATLVFSHDRDAGVLVMNNVAPPAAGTVYQMWLVNPQGVTSAGVMDAKAVSPSTTAVLPDLGDSTALAFTVEPGNGSPQPTGEIFAKLPIS
ncbi:anti-sigma-K factor RskA [soil metagenome]